MTKRFIMSEPKAATQEPADLHHCRRTLPTPTENKRSSLVYVYSLTTFVTPASRRAGGKGEALTEHSLGQVDSHSGTSCYNVHQNHKHKKQSTGAKKPSRYYDTLGKACRPSHFIIILLKRSLRAMIRTYKKFKRRQSCTHPF